MPDYIVHNLKPHHAEALRTAKVDMIDRAMAVQTLMLGADESAFALRDLADHYWIHKVLKPVPTEDSFEGRKAARKAHLAKLVQLEELRDAMIQIWGLTRVNHAIANSDLAEEETVGRPRTDKRACGRARRQLHKAGLDLMNKVQLAKLEA